MLKLSLPIRTLSLRAVSAPVLAAAMAAGLALFGGSVSAVAQEAATPIGPAGRALAAFDRAISACGDDVYRFCANVTPGGGALTRCLRANRDALTADCRAGLDRAAAARGATFACYADARRLCAGVVPGEGRIVACLAEQEAALSATCSEALVEAFEAFAE